MAKKKAKKKNPQVALAETLRNQGITDANNLYARSKGDLTYTHNEVADFLGAMGRKNNEVYGNARANIRQSQLGMLSGIDNQTASAKNAAQAELQRLGIQQTGLGDFDQDARFLRGMANQSAEDMLHNNNTARVNQGTVGELLKGMNAGDRGSSMGKAVNMRDQQITDLRNQFARARLEIEAQRAAQRRSGGGGGRSYGGGGGGYYGGGGSSYSRSSGGSVGSGSSNNDYGYNRDKPRGVSAAVPVDALTGALVGGLMGAYDSNGRRRQSRKATTGKRPAFKGIR